jgi:high affinity sulfate transporter 1
MTGRLPCVGMSAARTPTHWLPGLEVAKAYRRSWLAGDVTAGLVLSALLVPQGMAYAQLAGLPAVSGLYTTVMGLLAYALFGPSRILVLGPDSSLGPLIAAVIIPIAGSGGDPAQAIAIAGVLAILMGVICLAAGIARLGTVAELLSKPVRIGYLNGIAIVVLVSQLPRFFGFPVDATSTLGVVAEVAAGIVAGKTNLTALAIGAGCLAIILAIRSRRPRVPGVLVAVVGATVAVIVFDLDETGISLVGAVPDGFPRPSLPSIGLEDISRLGLAALGMAFVTLADTSALSRVFAAKAGDDVDPNQEIAALGAANIAAGLFQGFPLSASSSRTAVAKTAGAHTQLVGVVGAITIVILLVWGNRLTTFMPSASLAAIVIAAAIALFDLDELVWLWRARRSEFTLCVSAILGVVVLGVLEGIVVAIALSLGNFILRAWRPHDAVLGRVPQRKGYHDLSRHPEGSNVAGLVIYRFDAPLFFANAEHFARRIHDAIGNRDEPVRWVVVAAEPITDIDTTGAEVLEDLVTELRAAGTEVVFAELKGPVKDRLVDYGMGDVVDDAHLFPTLGTAINGFLAATGTTWDDPVDGPRTG